tara:strand:+ start:102 stop:428 length:327 start_codon:yes stop_codon:yes gene_type:complete
MKLHEIFTREHENPEDHPKSDKKDVTKGKENIALDLPRGETKVLRAEGDDYDRGMLVRLLNNGGYNMAYWYDTHEPYPVEILVDGKSIKKDARIVTMLFHPELKKDED